MFSNATVEFRPLLGREIEFSLLLSWCKAVPESHSEVDTLACRKFQKLRQGVLNMCPIPPRHVGLDNVFAAANAHADRPERATRALVRCSALLGLGSRAGATRPGRPRLARSPTIVIERAMPSCRLINPLRSTIWTI